MLDMYLLLSDDLNPEQLFNLNVILNLIKECFESGIFV